MQRNLAIATVTVVVAIGLGLSAVLRWTGGEPPASRRQTAPVPGEDGAAPGSWREDAALGAAVLREVRRVAGDADMRAEALVSTEGVRIALVLLAAAHRHASLDGDLAVADLPPLRAAGFAPPPHPVAMGMSIHRANVRRALAHDRQRGDLIFILHAPDAEHDALLEALRAWVRDQPLAARTETVPTGTTR